MINVGQKLRAAILELDRVKIKELLRNGADPNAVIPGEDFAAIHLGAGTTKSITQLLLNHGANPNLQTGEGSTPLHIAVSWGKSDILKVLLKYGADETIRDNENFAAIELAQNYEFWDCLNILQKRSKRRLRNQLEREKKKCSLRQSVDSPAQVKVNVHHGHIDVFTELLDRKSHGWNTDDFHGDDRNRRSPLMSAIFSLPQHSDKESDSVTSSETSTISSSVKVKKYLKAGSIEHNCRNPDTEDFFSADPTSDTEVYKGSFQIDDRTKTVETETIKNNRQNVENKNQKDSTYLTSKSKSRQFSDPYNPNQVVDDIRHCMCVDQCSSVETDERNISPRHLEHIIGHENMCKYIVKDDHTDSDDSTVNFDTVSTVISTVVNDVRIPSHSEAKLDIGHLQSDKHDCYTLERKDGNEFVHREELENQIKHEEEPRAENDHTNKKSDFHSAKKSESKCQESSDAFCFCNKNLQIKIDLRFGPMKSKNQNFRDNNSSKSSHISTLHDNVRLGCCDNETEKNHRVANGINTTQPDNIYSEINNTTYKLTKDVLDDPVVKVHARSSHDLQPACLDKNTTKQNRNDSSRAERTQERNEADITHIYNNNSNFRGSRSSKCLREESKTQRNILKDKFLRDLKKHLRIS